MRKYSIVRGSLNYEHRQTRTSSQKLGFHPAPPKRMRLHVITKNFPVLLSRPVSKHHINSFEWVVPRMLNTDAIKTHCNRGKNKKNKTINKKLTINLHAFCGFVRVIIKNFPHITSNYRIQIMFWITFSSICYACSKCRPIFNEHRRHQHCQPLKKYFS